MTAAELKPGDRIKLVHTDDPYTKLKPGDLGTVTRVNGFGDLDINWDTGSTLSMIAGEDSWEKANDD